MPKMSVATDRLTAKIVTPSIYEVQFKGFKPQISKNKDSINFNPSFEVIEDAITHSKEWAGAYVMESLNTKMETFIQDFVHAFGLTMEDNGDGTSSIPGDWLNFDPNVPLDQQDTSKWEYTGPLSGRTIKVELKPTEYQGRKRNSINRYICTVPSCNVNFPDIVHQANMIR